MEEGRGLDLLAADAGRDQHAEQPRRVHGVEHVGGNDAVAIDPVGGPRDQGNKLRARPISSAPRCALSLALDAVDTRFNIVAFPIPERQA